MKIAAFPYAVFRTPCFAFNKANVEALFSSPVFNEALLLASPELYAEKAKADEKEPGKYPEKLRLSLYKYASRAMTRPTPFGLFAGCSVATVGEQASVMLQNQSGYGRCTRLDMHYLCALVQHLEKNELIRSQLLYYPNDSLYELGGRLRYVEHRYQGTRRVHHISGVEASDYIQALLEAARQGAGIAQVATLLIDDEISAEEATAFVHELIDNQLLKSELEIGVTGANPLEALISRLEKLEGVHETTQALQQIRNLLSAIDKAPAGTTIPLYQEVIGKIKGMGVEYEPRFLFQADLYKPAPQADVSQDVVKNLIEGLNFLNKITPRPPESNLSKFQEAFYGRYEEQEVPLLEALDKELGIGYPAGQNDGDASPLIDGIVIPAVRSNNQIMLGEWGKLLLKKYATALQEKQSCITLTDDDVKNRTIDWEDFPSTFSCMCELIDEQTIYIKSSGGSSAANLLGRFCHLNAAIEKHAKDITKKEQELNQDVLYAEIVHLPESRIGNILFRPVLREYEIPYLCKVGTDKEHVLSLADLTICIRNGRLVLRAKTLAKEVVPRLSTAHNYYHNAMPVYQFLGDMQHPVGRIGIAFSWGAAADMFDYLPRVVYKNCILARTRWVIKKEELQAWGALKEDKLMDVIATYRKERRMPERAVIPDGDNELFVNFTDLLSIQTFLGVAKKRDKLIMEEFLFDEENAVVRSEEGVFCNEFIFAFYNEGGRHGTT